jgi:tagatose 1,6-diphosphate aldolase
MIMVMTQTETFRFLKTGRLIDGDLELVVPEDRWIEPHLKSCHHPLTRTQMPQHANASRDSFEYFLRTHPGGHQPPNALQDVVPAYHFWMHLLPERAPVIPIAGAIGLRIASTPNIELYFGHIGYHVYPAARGNHYAERSCRLLIPLARAHGLSTLWITCNPENIASRQTCERLGAQLVETVMLPSDNLLYKQGDREKCRYRLDI